MVSADSEKDEFHMWIGYCISAWAKVEDHLFEICWKSLGAPKARAAIVYYRTPTLDARLQLTDELVKSALPRRSRKSGGHNHASVARWEKMRSGIIGLLTIRRRIAHHPVRTIDAHFSFKDSDGPQGPGFQLSWYEIYVSEHEELARR